MKVLGKGGEGSVWLAVHIQTEQLWAIKELPRKEDGREFHEVEMMKKLQHPGLPKVLDVLETETHLYLVTEYIRGYTLEEIKQKQGRFSAEQVWEVGEMLCDVLCYLHERKEPVFHLDVKPANIIRKKDGRLVLVDFGAARKTLSHAVEMEKRGTDGFAAPEQYDKEALLDGRTDIFGLGATMYYLISGVKYSLPLWKSRVPGCPEYLNGIIHTCVQALPERRYQNCRQLQREMIRQKRKREAGRWRCKLWMALLLLILSVGSAVRELPEAFAVHMEESWNYEKLLEEALCVPWKEGVEYYRQALFLEPERKEAYLQYLDSADNDGVFSQTEEEVLRVLLHSIPLGQSQTYEELLASSDLNYAQVSTQIGVTYWFYYESDDKRRVAGGWFAKAQNVLRKLPENREKEEWEVQAEVFAHMSTYFEQIGREGVMESGNPSLDYWEDFGKILKQKGSTERLDFVELQFLREAMGQMIFLIEELQAEGVTTEEIKERIQYVMERIKNTEPLEEGRKIEEQWKKEITQQSQTVLEILKHDPLKEDF